MVKRFCFLLASFVLPAAAQMFPLGTPLPKTLLPPVVFLNGYQADCSSSTFSGTFGRFDQFLQTSGRVSVFFDNCTIAGKPSIETLANAFGTFLGSLKYADGSTVTQVDVVSHSMGGMIVRAYLAGMQTDGSFKPPANPGIRKAMFLSTPNFGTYAASVFGVDAQTQELALGSTFNFALATWNQGTDDLRGVDALAVAGNGGSMNVNGQSNGDGVSSLTSSSIGFAETDRTRILPYCHIEFPDLQGLLGLIASFVCAPGSPGIAKAVNATDSNVLIVQSFLNGTPDWQTIGQSLSDYTLTKTSGGLLARVKNAADQYLTFFDASAGSASLSLGPSAISAYNEFLAAGTTTVTANIVSNPQQKAAVNIASGTTTTLLLKPGPLVAAVIPAAALVTPRNIAPGTFASIYGAGLSSGVTAQATSAPFPTILGGVQVLVNGSAIPLQYVSDSQINAVFPTLITGLVTVTVTNTVGKHTVNVLTQSAVPAVFTSDGKAAAAINAVTGVAVTASTPLHGGDYVSLFVTGLGTTAAGANDLQYASIQPTVTVGGLTCAIQFAGLSPQFPGVDQINCQIPPGLGANAAVPVIVTSNGRASNTSTLVLQ